MTYYYDVTELVAMRLNSGIQRVVREVTARAVATSETLTVPVVAIGDRFYRLKPESHDLLSTSVIDGGSTHSPAKSGRLKNAMRRIRPLFRFAQQMKFRRRLRAMRDVYRAEPEAIGEGDVLVLIDSLWSGGTALDAAERARRNQAEVVLVVYDMIPVNHPELVSREVAYNFPRIIRRALDLSDGVVTISRQASAELMAFAPGLDPVRVTHAYLGHDFTPPVEGASAQTFPDALWRAGEPVYLMVGTIEPRKGHAYVLDGFECLWSEGGNQTLLIIGKPGWHGDSFIERCRALPQFGRQLFLIHDADDALLGQAILRSDALIMASWLEGFGLPLVEALSAGRPVLASDIAVFREIADGTALFFPVGNAAAVADAIHQFESAREIYRARAEAFFWIDWDQAAAGYRTAIDTVLRRGSGGGGNSFATGPVA